MTNRIFGWNLDAFDLGVAVFWGKKSHPRMPFGPTDVRR